MGSHQLKKNCEFCEIENFVKKIHKTVTPRPTFMKSYFLKVRVCCDFRDKSACMLWFSRQKNAYVVNLETKVPILWFLQQKCASVVIFTTTIVFLVFLVQIPVFSKFLVPTLAQFIGSCQQKQ